MQVGKTYYDFKLVRREDLPDIRGGSEIFEFVHPSGDTHIHIANNDPENTFGIRLKTVPQDSTGIAHILEHIALAGSKNFPVKDPFFSMLTRSLNTFMNAFTAPDWTMYPFSTENEKDYYNLMSVYADAVFFPKIDKLSFLQEGWCLEVEKNKETKEENLAYGGVVYNEMKGAMSSPNQIMERSLMNALYPDTTYSFNSGGDPREIVNLSHADLVVFHERHYHPSNAFSYSYGNFPVEKTLALLQGVLKDFSKIDPDTEVLSQPHWDKPKSVEYKYPLAKNEDPTKKYQACVAWLVADVRDSLEVLTLDLLNIILLGDSASPLRKALIDSKIGSTLSDSSGLETDLKDTMFSVGLKDIKKEDASKVQNLIFETLENLVKNGIDQKLIDSALHQLEFKTKEVTNSPYPYGIKVLLRFLESYIHGGDLAERLDFGENLSVIQEGIQKGRFFEKKIKEYFLNNSHHVRFVLSPGHEMAEKEQERVRLELEEIKKGMTAEEIESIKKVASELKKLQDSEEDLSCLPTLSLSEVKPPKKIEAPDIDTTIEGNKVLVYDQPTSGIFYFTGAIGLGELKKDLLPLIPFFCHILNKVGTEKRGYEDVVRQINTYTGGINFSSMAGNNHKNGKTLTFVSLNAKCLEKNTKEMMKLVEELLIYHDFFDHDRLKNLLLEYVALLESRVLQNGHRFAISLAARNTSKTSFVNELWNGISQLKFAKKLVLDIKENGIEHLSMDLDEIASLIFKKNNMKVALIGDIRKAEVAKQCLNIVFKKMTAGKSNFVYKHKIPENCKVREGWSTSSGVSFVASVFRAVKFGHPDAPVLAVLARLMRSKYLHKEIREKGKAYGGFSLYSIESGNFAFGSYRDPHIVRTLEKYNSALDFINSGNFTEEDVKEAILSVCAEIDEAETPSFAARKDFFRRLSGMSYKQRKMFKDRVLEINKDVILKVARRYFKLGMKMSTAVISGQPLLESANKELGDKSLELHKI